MRLNWFTPLLGVLFIFQSTLWAQEDFPKVMAQEGDGIYSLLRRHGVSPTKHYNNFVKLNAEDLGEDESLILGRHFSSGRRMVLVTRTLSKADSLMRWTAGPERTA